MRRLLYTGTLALTLLMGSLPNGLIAQTRADKPQSRASLVAQTPARNFLARPNSPRSNDHNLLADMLRAVWLEALHCQKLASHGRPCVCRATEIGASPSPVDYLQDLSRKVAQNTAWSGLYIGDISQPRGGPMLSGHASHQIGLDADIWLLPKTDKVLTRAEREKVSSISMRRASGAYTNDQLDQRS